MARFRSQRRGVYTLTVVSNLHIFHHLISVAGRDGR